MKKQSPLSKRRKSTEEKKRSTKGALIKGMSRRLPSEILESSIFAEHLQKMMRRYAGIYALYKGERIYYIGQTKDHLGRLKWQLKDRHAGKWDCFKIFRIRRVRYLKDIETLIHHLVETPGNRVKGRVPKDADLNRILRNVLAEHKKAIEDIERAL